MKTSILNGPASSVGFKPRALRSAQGSVIKDLFAEDRLPAFFLHLGGLEESELLDGAGRFTSIMTGSDLWKPLMAAYGKCDGMVAGKYRKARVFCFDTESLHLLCNTETGDRGSSWFVFEKVNFDPSLMQVSDGYSSTDFLHKPHLRDELVHFTVDLLLDLVQAYPATRTRFAKLGATSWTPLLKMEADEEAVHLAAAVSPARVLGRKLRV